MLALESQIKWNARLQKIVISSFVLMIAGFYFLGYLPESRRQRDMMKTVALRTVELRENSQRGMDLTAVAAEVQKLQARLDGSKKLPAQNDLAEFIREMTQLSQQSSLKKFQYKPEPAKRSELFAMLPIQVTFEGDFVSVFSFLRQTESMQRLIRISQLNLRSRDGSATGTVQVELSMNIYFSPDE